MCESECERAGRIAGATGGDGVGYGRCKQAVKKVMKVMLMDCDGSNGRERVKQQERVKGFYHDQAIAPIIQSPCRRNMQYPRRMRFRRAKLPRHNRAELPPGQEGG